MDFDIFSIEEENEEGEGLDDLLIRLSNLMEQVNTVKEKITNIILAEQRTFKNEVGVARYNPGRRTFDYESVGASADPALITKHTSEVVDWKSVVEEAGIAQEAIPYKQGEPSVTFKFNN